MGSKANGNPESFLDRFSWGGLFQDFSLGFFGWFGMRWLIFRERKREDKRKKRSILSVIFLHKHKNCIRDFCVISTYIFMCFSDGHLHRPHIFPTTLLHPHLFKKQRKTRKKKVSNSRESSEIAIHPLLHRSIQRIQRHHKAHDDLQADLRPHPRLLSPRLRRVL